MTGYILGFKNIANVFLVPYYTKITLRSGGYVKNFTLCILVLFLGSCAQHYAKPVCSEGNAVWIDTLVNGKYLPEGGIYPTGITDAEMTVKRDEQIGLYHIDQDGVNHKVMTCQFNNSNYLEFYDYIDNEYPNFLMNIDLNKHQELYISFPYTTEETLNKFQVPYTMNENGEFFIDNKNITTNDFVQMFDQKLGNAFVLLKKL